MKIKTISRTCHFLNLIAKLMVSFFCIRSHLDCSCVLSEEGKGEDECVTYWFSFPMSRLDPVLKEKPRKKMTSQRKIKEMLNSVKSIMCT